MTANEEWGLIGKVAIVTGGGAQGDGIGNGRAAAILLARAGANVLVVDRDLGLAERTVAMDHGEQGIRVNCVVPGPVYTPLIYVRGITEQARDARRQASVLKREGTGWDIGNAVRFLLSDQARYITGHVLVVDGGASLVGPSRASQ